MVIQSIIFYSLAANIDISYRAIYINISDLALDLFPHFSLPPSQPGSPLLPPSGCVILASLIHNTTAWNTKLSGKQTNFRETDNF